MNKLRFISYGESLVDFLPSERGRLRDVSAFTKSLGGAPTNQAVALARLEEDICLLGVVGEDEFGHFIKEELTREGVDSEFVTTTSIAKTGITFISLDEKGDRSFFFFREPSADQTITKDSISLDVFKNRDVLTLGSNLLTREPARSATFYVAELAKKEGLDIAIDVNYRGHLWESTQQAKKEILKILTYCSIVKVNEEEFEFLRDGASAKELFSKLNEHRCKALVITKAERGAMLITEKFQIDVGAPKTEVVDTTGAGDGFIAGLLSSISRIGAGRLDSRLEDLTEDEWKQVVSFACRVGSAVCTKMGATPGLPRRSSDLLRS